MTAILFIVIGAALMYFFMNSKSVPSAPIILVDDFSDFDKFLYYKKQIIETSAYSDETNYFILYKKVSELTDILILKHRATIMPNVVVEQIESNFEKYFEIENDRSRIRRTLKIEEVQSEVLLALAVICFSSFNKLAGQAISKNRFFTNRVIEYLIEERNFWEAILAKALILKYGFQEFLAPQTDYVRELFKSLSHYPIFVNNEVADLIQLRVLEQLTTKHMINTSILWKPNEEIKRAVESYHPDNING